jgi:hypothetical protein
MLSLGLQYDEMHYKKIYIRSMVTQWIWEAGKAREGEAHAA